MVQITQAAVCLRCSEVWGQCVELDSTLSSFPAVSLLTFHFLPAQTLTGTAAIKTRQLKEHRIWQLDYPTNQPTGSSLSSSQRLSCVTEVRPWSVWVWAEHPGIPARASISSLFAHNVKHKGHCISRETNVTLISRHCSKEGKWLCSANPEHRVCVIHGKFVIFWVRLSLGWSERIKRGKH